MCAIEVCDKWACRWPRPDPIDATIIHVGLLESGAVELFDIGRVRQECWLARAWYDRLCQRSPLFQATGAIDAGQLMRVCNQDRALDPLASQIAWRASLRLQIVFGGDASSEAQGRPGQEPVSGQGARVTSFSFQARDSSHISIHLAIAKYVFNSLERNKRHTLIGISTDKGWANALPLHQSVVTTADNHAMLTCPVVPAIGACPSANPNAKFLLAHFLQKRIH